MKLTRTQSNGYGLRGSEAGRERVERGGGLARQPLSARERAAIREVIRRVRGGVRAELVRTVLFGSRARGEARPDSDLDLLLIFRALPPDREPHATQAEQIADRVAAESRVPVTTWSVALSDLACGMRTPMLVDALEDGVAVWPPRAPKWRVPFTPADAVRCSGALLERVAEGSEEVAAHLRAGDGAAAAHRIRGDIVRLCIAVSLLHGETRPRRAEAVRRYLETARADGGLDGADAAVLGWAMRSFGPAGRDEERPVALPVTGVDGALRTVERLRRGVRASRARLAQRVGARRGGLAIPNVET